MKENNLMISIENLRKSYTKNVEVLKGINLNIHKGEKIAILGANGSGKTTLIEIISQSKKASKGKVKYFFETNDPKYEIGIQFQEGSWPSGLSSFDVIQFYKKIYPSITDERIENLVKAFGLNDFYKRPLDSLSGGQKQRFNALLSMIHNPEVIILDEISNGLDLELKHSIIKFLKEYLSENKNTLLIVSHSPGEVQSLCDRLIIINDGICFFDMKVSDAVKKYKSVENLMNLYFDGKLESNNA